MTLKEMIVHSKPNMSGDDLEQFPTAQNDGFYHGCVYVYFYSHEVQLRHQSRELRDVPHASPSSCHGSQRDIRLYVINGY